MSRSRHHGCGKTCGICKPHKFTGEEKPSVARQIQDMPPEENLHPAEERLIEHDAFEAERKRVQALPRDAAQLTSFGSRCEYAPEYEASTPIHWVPGTGWVEGCTAIVPGTFIVCGEGGNFCSDACMKRPALKRVMDAHRDILAKLDD